MSKAKSSNGREISARRKKPVMLTSRHRAVAQRT